MEHRMEMNRECGESMHGGFKHFLPLLAIPLVIGLMRGVGRHKFAHMAEMRRENWKNGVPPMFAELHRRAHEAEAAEAAKPAEPQA